MKKIVLIFGFALLLFAALGANPAVAQTSAQAGTSYFVRANGNDANNGTSENTPFKTLAKAVEAASKSAVKKITVIGKLGDVSVEIKDSGETEILITGKQNPSEQEKAVISAAKDKNGLRIVGKSNIRFEYITFTDSTWSMIVIVDGPVVTFTDGVIVTGNSAGQGAGLHIKKSTVRLTGNAQIINNLADSGGGIFIFDNSTLIVEGNALIASNKAGQRNGGGLNVQDSKITIQGNVRIIDNVAAQTGGGINLAGENGSTAVIGGNVIISGNKAVQGGGVVIWDDCSVTVADNARISGNTAISGGDVQLAGGSLIRNGGTVTNVSDGLQ